MDAVTKVRMQFQALETGDVALAVEAVSPDWEDHEATLEQSFGDLRGPASLVATGVWMRWGIPDLAFEELAVVADERHVVYYGWLTGTQTGPLMSFRDGRVARFIPPSGRRVRVRQTHIHEVRGGEVVSHSAVRDDLGMLTQMGMMPPSPATLATIARWRASGRLKADVAELVAAQRAAVAQL